jgi:hypothetical protein
LASPTGQLEAIAAPSSLFPSPPTALSSTAGSQSSGNCPLRTRRTATPLCRQLFTEWPIGPEKSSDFRSSIRPCSRSSTRSAARDSAQHAVGSFSPQSLT